LYLGREEFDELETPSVLSNEIQECVDSIIRETHDVDWNEDSLTLGVIGGIRKILSDYTIPYMDNAPFSNKFDVEAYKITGKPEQSHGDIAVVVTRIFPNFKNPTSGVAFYEAKASSNTNYGNRFPSFNVQQLRRLVTKTPRLTYLIYDRENRQIGTSDWPSRIDTSDRMLDYGQTKTLRSYTVDANLLKNIRDIDVAAGLYGKPFGEHFVKNVLSGRDLDYSASAEKIIKKWIKATKNSNPLIVSISVHEPGVDISAMQLTLPGFEKINLAKIDEQVKINNKSDSNS